MATIKLNRSIDFATAINMGDDLGDALSAGEMFEQDVLIERMNGENESVMSFIRIEGDLARIGVIRDSNCQHLDMHVPVTTSPMDAEELILSLTLELLLS